MPLMGPRQRALRLATLLFSVRAFVGCLGNATCEETRTCPAEPAPASDFSLSVDASALTLQQGERVSLNVAVNRSANVGDVVVDAVGLPPGVSAAPTTIAAAETAGKLEVVAAQGATQGAASVTIRAQAGNEQRAQSISLLVRGAPGSLDQTFGDHGVADTSWSLVNPPRGPLLFESGAFAVVGTVGLDTDFEIARFLENGKLDPELA